MGQYCNSYKGSPRVLNLKGGSHVVIFKDVSHVQCTIPWWVLDVTPTSGPVLLSLKVGP